MANSTPAHQCEAFTLTHTYEANGTPIPGPRCRRRSRNRFCSTHDPALNDPALIDYSKVFRQTSGKLMMLLRAMSDGKWAPDGMEAMLLHFMARAIDERKQGPVPPDFWEQIEQHLRDEQL